MRAVLAQVAIVTGWLVIIVLLALWLVAAVHRGRASGVWIVAIALTGIIVVPVLAARLNKGH